MIKPRVPVTFLLPERLARAIIEAAVAANRLTEQGEIIQDHMIFASARETEFTTFKTGVFNPLKEEKYPFDDPRYGVEREDAP